MSPNVSDERYIVLLSFFESIHKSLIDAKSRLTNICVDLCDLSPT